MIGFASDLRYAFRAVLKNPRFSLVAVAALALGIGANAAIFSVVNAVLLQPLPYPEANRLVRLCRQFDGPPQCAESIPKFVAWSRAQAFDAIAAYDFAGPGLNLGGGDRPEQIKGIHVSAGYFRVFGAAAEAGRTFTPQEDAPGGPRAVVITHKLWQSRFAGDTAMAGRTITLNGDSYTVIGILPAAFRSEPPADVFIPLQADPNSTNHGNYLSVAAHLKPGATIASAQAEMNVLAAQFRQDNPKWMTEQEKAGVFGMLDIAVGNVRPALLILLGAVGLVLLIACANVANLLLARAAGRQREVAIRAAIGAGRARIFRQLIVESLLLSALGAIAGCVVGVLGARALISLSPGGLPRAHARRARRRRDRAGADAPRRSHAPHPDGCEAPGRASRLRHAQRTDAPDLACRFGVSEHAPGRHAHAYDLAADRRAPRRPGDGDDDLAADGGRRGSAVPDRGAPA